jgi:general stress protein YciG
MADNNDKRGLAKADEETRERVASMGGQAQPKEVKREAGKKGGSRSRRS